MTGLFKTQVDHEAEALIAAQVQQLSYDITHLSETSEKLATGVMNHVLEAGTRVVDTSGGFTLSFGATAGAVLIRNPSTATITIAAGQAYGVRPSQGPGVHDVEGRTWRLVPVDARYLSVYGTVGQRVGYEVFANRPAPAAGMIGDPVTTGTALLGTDPTAGTEVSQTVPAGEYWTLTSVLAQLVTSATVANRRVHLVVDDGVNIVANYVAAADQAASATVTYTWDGGGADATTVRDGVASSGQLPVALQLRPGWRVRTVTSALDVGDNWGAPVLTYARTLL